MLASFLRSGIHDWIQIGSWSVLLHFHLVRAVWLTQLHRLLQPLQNRLPVVPSSATQHKDFPTFLQESPCQFSAFLAADSSHFVLVRIFCVAQKRLHNPALCIAKNQTTLPPDLLYVLVSSRLSSLLSVQWQ